MACTIPKYQMVGTPLLRNPETPQHRGARRARYPKNPNSPGPNSSSSPLNPLSLATPKKTKKPSLAIKGTKRHTIWVLDAKVKFLQNALADTCNHPSLHGIWEYIEPMELQHHRQQLHCELQDNLRLNKLVGKLTAENNSLKTTLESISCALNLLPASLKQRLAHLSMQFKFLAW